MTATAPVLVNGMVQAPSLKLRLTRRGRVVVTTLVVALIIGLVFALTMVGGAATATTDLSSGSFDYVTVQSGQSLWQLAESIAPGADPREVISDLAHLNQLQSSVIQPGDRIAIPMNYAR